MRTDFCTSNELKGAIKTLLKTFDVKLWDMKGEIRAGAKNYLPQLFMHAQCYSNIPSLYGVIGDCIPASMGLAWESQKCLGSWHCDWQQRKDAKSCHTGCFQMIDNLTKIYFSLVPFLGRPFIDYLLSLLQWNEVRVFKDSPEKCFQLIKVYVAPECVLFLPEKYQVTL